MDRRTDSEVERPDNSHGEVSKKRKKKRRKTEAMLLDTVRLNVLSMRFSGTPQPCANMRLISWPHEENLPRVPQHPGLRLGEPEIFGSVEFF